MAPKPCCIAPIQPLIYNAAKIYQICGSSMTRKKRKRSHQSDTPPNKNSKPNSADNILSSIHECITTTNNVQSDTLIQLLIKHGHTPWPKSKDLTLVHYAISLAARQGKTACFWRCSIGTMIHLCLLKKAGQWFTLRFIKPQDTKKPPAC